MGTDISLNSSILERVEKYICLFYGKKKCNSTDDVRLQMFWGKYIIVSKKGSENDTTLKIKKLGGSSWPPCSRILVQKIKRTMFAARQWRCSCIEFQRTSKPCEYGWRLENNKCHYWMVQTRSLPLCVLDILIEVDKADLGDLSTNLLL